MSNRSPEHWLWRLGVEGWLAAADAEIGLARTSLATRRKAITHARRGAGMALNAVLVALANREWEDALAQSAWGRSYVDHLRAVASAGLDRSVSRILTVPVTPTGRASGLVTIGRGAGAEVHAVVADAAALVDICRRVASSRT